MLATGTSNATAMVMQESLAFTVYSMGGSGVAVGTGVLVRVAVGVKVSVGVMVTVGVWVGSSTRPVPLNTPYTVPAPMAIRRMTSPIAIGSDRVSLGSRGVVTPEDFSALAVGEGVSVRPQTRQRVAFSLTGEPQVGHFFEEVVLGVLIGNFERTGANSPAPVLYHNDFFVKSSRFARTRQV